MLSSKRGAAILQVLLVAAVLAGLSVLLLRASLSRASSSHQTRRVVSSQLEIDSCMAEINQLFAIKSANSFTRDMDECVFYCRGGGTGSCADPVTEYNCFNNTNAGKHLVTARIAKVGEECRITYTIQQAADL